MYASHTPRENAHLLTKSFNLALPFADTTCETHLEQTKYSKQEQDTAEKNNNRLTGVLRCAS